MPGTKLTESVQRVFLVLEAFVPYSDRLRLPDVVERTGLPKVTAFRFLKTLVSLGYLAYDIKTRAYALTPKIVSLGLGALGAIELRQVAFPYLGELAAESNQNINLGVVDGTDIVYIEHFEKRRIPSSHVGVRLKLHISTGGKVALAFMDESVFRATMVEIVKEPNALSYAGPRGEKLIKQLKQIHKQGYALNDEEIDVSRIAVPIIGVKGTIEGVITMSVFKAEVSLKQLTGKYVPLLLQTAQRISFARGFEKK